MRGISLVAYDSDQDASDEEAPPPPPTAAAVVASVNASARGVASGTARAPVLVAATAPCSAASLPPFIENDDDADSGDAGMAHQAVGSAPPHAQGPSVEFFGAAARALLPPAPPQERVSASAQAHVARLHENRAAFIAEHVASRSFCNPHLLQKLSRDLGVHAHASQYDVGVYAAAAPPPPPSQSTRVLHLGADDRYAALARCRERAEEEARGGNVGAVPSLPPAPSPPLPAPAPALPLSQGAAAADGEPAPKKARRSKWDQPAEAAATTATTTSALLASAPTAFAPVPVSAAMLAALAGGALPHSAHAAAVASASAPPASSDAQRNALETAVRRAMT